CFFFFSSRRRHTRCLSDWSSDVCSSDLVVTESRSGGGAGAGAGGVGAAVPGGRGGNGGAGPVGRRVAGQPFGGRDQPRAAQCGRSEERRVGKECGCRWGEE